MIKKIKEHFQNKELINNFRFNKSQSIWFLINQFKINKIEILQEEFIKKINDESSFEELNELLKSYQLKINNDESDTEPNFVLFKINDTELNIGVIISNENNIYNILTTEQECKIDGEYILQTFHVTKEINYLDFSENIEKEPFSFKWFIKEMFLYKSLWRNILFWSLLMQGLSFTLPLMTQTIVDKVIVNQAESTLISLVVGVFIFNLFNIGLTWARQNLILFIGNKIDNVLAIKVMSKLFRLPIFYFQKRATGNIISRVHSVESIREFLSGTFMTLILDIPFVFVFLLIMFSYSIPLSLITLFFVFLMMLLSILVAPLIRKKALEQAQLSGKNQAFVTEYVSAIETVKSLQIEEHLNNEYKRNFSAYLSKTKETRELAINYNSMMSWLEQTLNLLILGIGAYLSMHGTEFTIGMLIAFQMFSSRVTQPLLRVSNVWQEFQQTQISMIRLKDIMDQEEESSSLLKSNIFDFNGEISVNNLSFKYEQHLPFVYENLNLKFRPKSLTVITGPSGCGKSTLTKLLQGFYNEYQGDIIIDGINIKQMGLINLRKYFGIVPQETTLFSGTILDNFKLVNPYIELEEVIKYCKDVGIHEAISKLPEQYNTVLGEKGSGLSGGQKQRIAIARALSKKPKILIFDESISNLDEKSKKLVCETIQNLNGKITMIFITHIELEGIGPHFKIDMSNISKK